jgi:hypothetical protein
MLLFPLINSPKQEAFIMQSNNLGTLKLGKTYRASGSVGNGETAVYRFKLNDLGRNALTLNSRSSGSLEFVNISDRQGKFPANGGSSRATVSSSVSGGEGQISNSFSGMTPGVYFLRIKGAGSGDNTYSFRLKYEPAADSAAVNFSSISSSGFNFSSSTGSSSSSSSSSSALFE